MFAVNTSITRTINQTSFKVVFGQQPRINDHLWKCIKSQLKDRQHGESSHIILEEDLPSNIFEMAKQVDDIESLPIDPKTTNLNEEPTCTTVAEVINQY